MGHSERCSYRAGGSAVSLLQPLLDNQVHLFSITTLITSITIAFSITTPHLPVPQVGLKNMEGPDRSPMLLEKVDHLITCPPDHLPTCSPTLRIT